MVNETIAALGWDRKGPWTMLATIKWKNKNKGGIKPPVASHARIYGALSQSPSCFSQQRAQTPSVVSVTAIMPNKPVWWRSYAIYASVRDLPMEALQQSESERDDCDEIWTLWSCKGNTEEGSEKLPNVEEHDTGLKKSRIHAEKAIKSSSSQGAETLLRFTWISASQPQTNWEQRPANER